MKTLVICVLLVWSVNVAAFPTSDTHKTKPLTKKQLRIAVTMMVIDRLQAIDIIVPVQMQIARLATPLLKAIIQSTRP